MVPVFASMVRDSIVVKNVKGEVCVNMGDENVHVKIVMVLLDANMIE